MNAKDEVRLSVAHSRARLTDFAAGRQHISQRLISESGKAHWQVVCYLEVCLEVRVGVFKLIWGFYVFRGVLGQRPTLIM